MYMLVGVLVLAPYDAMTIRIIDESGVIFVFRAGIRYYVAKNFSVYAETG